MGPLHRDDPTIPTIIADTTMTATATFIPVTIIEIIILVTWRIHFLSGTDAHMLTNGS